MKNNTFEEIAGALDRAETVLILTHVIIDGDAAGTAAALCRVLRTRGKTVHIFTGEELPHNLRLLDADYFVRDRAELLDRYDLVAAVDCSDPSRFEKRKDLYDRASVHVNIDHHRTNPCYAEYNYVDADAAAAGEILYEMIREAGWDIDVRAAEGIYTAIVTDTGEFEYSSTTAKTHRIAAELFDLGIDINEISVAIYQNERKVKLQVHSDILQNMDFLCEDRFVMAHAPTQLFEKRGAEISDSDGVIEAIRGIDTVEVARFAKEIAPDEWKLGFRSKYDIDVSAIAEEFGGGGHRKAAGGSMRGSIADVKACLYPKVEAVFREKDGRA